MSITSKRGDTIMEVAIAITVFCIVSIVTMGIMDRDLNSIQGSLELEMARNEIDSQAEALRFIHDSYLAEHEYNTKEYEALWKRLSHPSSGVEEPGLVNNPADISPFTATQCSAYYDKSTATTTTGEVHSIYNDHAFVINTRNLDPQNPNSTLSVASTTNDLFTRSALYPRIVYTGSGSDSDSSLVETYNQIASIEGIWVIAARDATDSTNDIVQNTTPEFFDYHIRTCWDAPGSTYPTTIATIVRLYNPDFEPIEEGNEGPTLSVSPNPVYTPGGEKITIKTNIAKDVPMQLSGANPVKIDSSICANPTLTEAGGMRAIECKTPALPANPGYNVSVTVSIRGEETTTLTIPEGQPKLKYVAPSITTVTPNTDLVGGQSISIITNITSDASISVSSVKVGGSTCTNPSVTSFNGNRIITCKAPNLDFGKAYDVSAEISIGDGNPTIPPITKPNAVKYKNPPTPNFFTTAYMQDMTSSVCNSVNTPSSSTSDLTANDGSNYYNSDGSVATLVPSTTLIDQRDNQVYTVRKLADGNCWMTENLRYGSTTSNAARAYQSSDLNLSDNMNSSVMSKLNSSHICTASSGCKTTDGKSMFSSSTAVSYTEPFIMIYQANTAATYDGKTKPGVLYNYCAASGGTACTSSGTTPKVSGSACPKNWTLPSYANTSTGSSSTSADDKSWQKLLNYYGVGDYSSKASNLIASPLSFLRVGYASSGYLSSNMASSYYWSSTINGNSVYSLYLNSSTTYRFNDGRQYGQPVRCVSR